MLQRLYIFLIVSVVFAATLKAQSPIVGVLEEVPAPKSGVQNRRAVRVAFEKEGSAWQAFPSVCHDERCLASITSKYPPEIVWTVAFGGENFGQITATSPKRFDYYAAVGLQEITSKGSIPTVGESAREYGGYSGSPVYRPLVTNSQAFVTDPDAWELSRLSTEQIYRLRQEFRRHFGKLCQLAKDDATLT
jgi:hypothetical protein